MPQITINDHPLPWNEILGSMLLFGKLQPFLQEVLVQYVLLQEIQSHSDLEVSTSDLMDAIMALRLRKQLDTQEKYDAWLQAEGLDAHSFQQRMILSLKVKRLRQAIAAPKLQSCFEQNRTLFETLSLQFLATTDAGLAEQLRERILAGETNLMQLSSAFTTPDRPGKITFSQQKLQRRRLQAALRSALATAESGTVVGPLQFGEGWLLCRVEEVLPAELDHRLQPQLEAQLFGEWLLEKSSELRLGMNLQAEPTSA
jgi:hypothetical protein